MKTLVLAFGLLVMLLPSTLHAQTETHFFGLDTLDGSRKMVLPMIYFPEGTTKIDARAREDLSYIAFMMHINPEASVRIKTQALYKRFDRKPRRLNKKRMKKIRKTLKRDYQVERKRIITIHHQPWQYRAAEDPRPSKLVQRRVVCDVIWDK